MTETVRVVVADDHPLFREGVVHSLSLEPDLEIVGEAADGEEAVRLTKDLLPDLVVMDLGMPEGGGIDATRRIAASAPATAVLILTVSEDRDDLLEALKAGAKGYVLKGVPADGLLHAVPHLHRIGAGGNESEPVVNHRLGEHGRGGRAVTGDVVGLVGYLWVISVFKS